MVKQGGPVGVRGRVGAWSRGPRRCGWEDAGGGATGPRGRRRGEYVEGMEAESTRELLGGIHDGDTRGGAQEDESKMEGICREMGSANPVGGRLLE